MVKNKILKRIVAGLSCIALSTTMLTSLPAFADDYVDEYQYYSTLDPNGEEYQEWKSNLASSAVSVPQNRMLKSILKNNTLIANDYIEFNTANNNLTSNAIEETKTLSNKLAISGYFDLFFSNETCSYYYTNSEVHEGNNFKFDPLTSVGNPILLAQFADDNYDCKINSLADQNTDIMCNIDGNIYLYTNISVNSGSVLFLNLSDGSFFINIDLDNDGEIDTTVTPTINPGVIQDDEKSPEITVESCNAGISNSNTINPNIVITNNSDKPLKMSDITINYVFNADNKENLEYHCDWLAVDNQYLGNTSVCEFVNDDYGNTYAKIKFNTDVELQPNKQFVIHFRLNAADWSNWDTSNDYSMGTEQLLPNDKIIVFYNEQLISGVQP
ncbi:MAG: cellulose binding domain-containing protein [Ruminococcus bicirculans (ex Wegman et al. 2014)]|uniref:cellulose binding domain-containing protein n=4 Tax=Ruminococcus bicirculans (ex Wegman et al. 2014) TaxID=1160721 RepID=UPI003994F19F